jgi:hypothetical protein
MGLDENHDVKFGPSFYYYQSSIRDPLQYADLTPRDSIFQVEISYQDLSV